MKTSSVEIFIWFRATLYKWRLNFLCMFRACSDEAHFFVHVLKQNTLAFYYWRTPKNLLNFSWYCKYIFGSFLKIHLLVFSSFQVQISLAKASCNLKFYFKLMTTLTLSFWHIPGHEKETKNHKLLHLLPWWSGYSKGLLSSTWGCSSAAEGSKYSEKPLTQTHTPGERAVRQRPELTRLPEPTTVLEP